MSEVLPDAYWQDEFDITKNDLDRIAKRMRENLIAYTLTELAKRLVRGRLKHGQDISTPALPSWIEEAAVCPWNPADEWKVGDRAIFAEDVEEDEFQPMVGEITKVTTKYVQVIYDGESEPWEFERAEPGSREAIIWHRTVIEAVQRKEKALLVGELDKRVDGVLLKHGDRIVRRLLTALQKDSRFVDFEDLWFLAEILVPLDDDLLVSLYRKMLVEKEPIRVVQALNFVEPPLKEGAIGLFSLHFALLNDEEERFGNLGTVTRPLWKANPPPWNLAVGTSFAYDPETYRILINPNQPLTKGVSGRLQELGIYSEVVTRAD